MKKKNIEKHLNINAITLVVTVFVVALLDGLKVYSISPVVMSVFLVGYTLYIVISTIIMIQKNNNIESKKNEENKHKK